MTDLRISQAQARADSRFYAHRVEPVRRAPVTPVPVKRYDNDLLPDAGWMQ